MKTRNVSFKTNLLFVFILVMALSLTTIAFAQLWTTLPPYNVLWPLWSPALSPIDPSSGLPKPLISTLTKDTFLPVEPALVWDPALPYFYLLYNYVPTYGSPYIKYFDPLEGLLAYSSFKTWPPSYLQTAVVDPLTGTTVAVVPSPLTLEATYGGLLNFDPGLWLGFWTPLVNALWVQYAGVNPALLPYTQLIDPLLTYTATYL